MNAFSTDPSRILEEFKDVLASAEEFIHAAATQSGEKLAQARANMERVVRAARDTVEQAQDSAKAAAAATEQTIKEHPWTAVSVSAGVGFLVGLLIARR